MKRILIIVFILLASLYAIGQNYELYLQKAFELLKKGDKENAEKCYGVYKTGTNKTDVDFESLLLKFKAKDEWQKSCYIINLGDGYTLAVQRKVGGDLRQQEANEKAQANRLGGFSDWRLPTKEELQIIIANLPDASYKNYDRGYYWTSTMSKSKSEIQRYYGKYYRKYYRKYSYFYVVNFEGQVYIRKNTEYLQFLVIRKYETLLK